MSDQSWYQRRLAQMRPAPFQGRQQPQQPYPAQYAPQPQYVQQAPVQAPQQWPQQQMAPQQPPPMRQGDDPAAYIMATRHLWQGGPGKKYNPDPCPQCGGNQFFANLGLKRRGPPPAPHCYDCGYNGLFDQGLVGNWGTLVDS